MQGIPSFRFKHLRAEVVRYGDEVLIETALYWGGKCIAIVALTPDEAAKVASTLTDLSKLAAEAESWRKKSESDDQSDQDSR